MEDKRIENQDLENKKEKEGMLELIEDSLGGVSGGVMLKNKNNLEDHWHIRDQRDIARDQWKKYK